MRESYYSQRNESESTITSINLEMLKELFLSIYNDLYDKCYFEEYIHSEAWDGYDRIEYPGKLVNDLNIQHILFLKLRKKDLWPIYEHIEYYKEEDLFDIIEFCYDNVSKPVLDAKGKTTGYDKNEGEKEYTTLLNNQLKDYENRYEIDKYGNVVIKAENGLEKIYDAEIPTKNETIRKKIENAIHGFRKRNSTLSERKDSVRNLADILEYLRPKLNEVITQQDEKDLFNIINNFGIRHMNNKQKENYEQSVWLSWMFYYYLSTIYSVLILLKRKNGIEVE